jgi:FdhE protein
MPSMALTPEALARERPECGRWLALLAEARRAFDDPLWARAVPEGAAGSPETRSPDRPLLHGATLRLDAQGAGRFVRRLFKVAAAGGGTAGPLGAAARTERLDALALLEAALSGTARGLQTWAGGLGVPAALLGGVAAVAVTPLLHACRRAWTASVPAGWDYGSCPICGAWATLAEARGLERSRRLRCGRCGADWRADWLRCVYCDNGDHRTLGALVPEAALEPRTVETCQACGGYLKTVATLAATAADAVALLDLATVELDIAALEHGYARPDEPAHHVRARVAAAIA